MRSPQILWLGVLLTLVATAAPPAVAGPMGPKGGDKPLKVFVQQPGQLFCPSSALVFEKMVIPGGRCFTLLLVRETAGTSLAFAEPELGVPPGQLVRLNTPAGAKLKGRIFFLVPVQTTIILIPVNTITLVPVRIEDFGPRLMIVLLGTPSPNVTVIFSVRL